MVAIPNHLMISSNLSCLTVSSRSKYAGVPFTHTKASLRCWRAEFEKGCNDVSPMTPIARFVKRTIERLSKTHAFSERRLRGLVLANRRPSYDLYDHDSEALPTFLYRICSRQMGRKPLVNSLH